MPGPTQKEVLSEGCFVINYSITAVLSPKDRMSEGGHPLAIPFGQRRCYDTAKGDSYTDVMAAVKRAALPEPIKVTISMAENVPADMREAVQLIVDTVQERFIDRECAKCADSAAGFALIYANTGDSPSKLASRRVFTNAEIFGYIAETFDWAKERFDFDFPSLKKKSPRPK